MVVFRGYRIVGTGGQWFVIVRGRKVGPFPGRAECEKYIAGFSEQSRQPWTGGTVKLTIRP